MRSRDWFVVVGPCAMLVLYQLVYWNEGLIGVQHFLVCAAITVVALVFMRLADWAVERAFGPAEARMDSLLTDARVMNRNRKRRRGR